MALDSYTNLKAAIADWLNRTDLATQIPDFISLAEAKMKRKIRKWTVLNSSFSITGAAVAAPADLSVPRSIRLDSGSPMQDKALRMGTIEILNDRKARSAGVAGRPDTVAFINGVFYFAPEPDQTYTAELFYFSTLTPLSASVASNSVLVEAPDAYLFGALTYSAPYLEHDERIQVWQQNFEEAIEQLNDKRQEDELTASLPEARLPMVFG